MKQCQGGWCAKRDQCPHYYAASSQDEPAERLCIRGRDGVRLIEASAFRVLFVSVFSGREIAQEQAA